MHNAMTVDVEDYFHVAAFASRIDPGDWDRYPSRVEANTHRLLALFAERQVRATWFVLGWVARRHPQLVKAIAAGGHEVACHGMSHQLIYRQSVARFRAETLAARKLLEDLSQQPVEGYRAASYSITRRSLWALDVLAEAGFLYDSSIFPVHHDRYGIPGAPRRPHRRSTPGGASLVEFPPATARFGPLCLPCAGGGYFRLYPYSLTRYLLKRCNGQDGQPFMFYLHPWELDPDQPRLPAGRLSRFRHYLNLHRCESRLTALLADFRFTTARRVLEAAGLLAAPAVPGGAGAAYA
ncbi:XrtA system polysaccharide deacetylase [Alkalilimnicola sp. S0819]|uniref:XrtA system polysaccharide deacetylase n=1 Tax=Alkalilimnicola sp. S0819 TaxID=2613922 RepID=UPI0012624B8C|nr:XrtA system polysaccharide deacetylase [Alkalilimnicola sp. S0819]KAB7622846.1 DUF3473 domain-containing protein [Alkalilimnicola sp. S0819]MPQ17168.1 DUF3473 domain-containing protein [Alkalilimnicola sp. S0819]